MNRSRLAGVIAVVIAMIPIPAIATPLHGPDPANFVLLRAGTVSRTDSATLTGALGFSPRTASTGQASITPNAGVNIACGRAPVGTAQVAMNGNVISTGCENTEFHASNGLLGGLEVFPGHDGLRTATPEPHPILLLLSGLFGIFVLRERKQRRRWV